MLRAFFRFIQVELLDFGELFPVHIVCLTNLDAVLTHDDDVYRQWSACRLDTVHIKGGLFLFDDGKIVLQWSIFSLLQIWELWWKDWISIAYWNGLESRSYSIDYFKCNCILMDEWYTVTVIFLWLSWNWPEHWTLKRAGMKCQEEIINSKKMEFKTLWNIIKVIIKRELLDYAHRCSQVLCVA